jgi:4-hydroxy-tetrahydrodipicolinate reductase
MGRAVCQAVTEADGLELAALVDADPSQGPVCGLEVTAELRAFAESGCDVVVDFTIAEATRGLVPFLAMHGIHAVIGTSGLSSDDVATFADALDSGGVNGVLAANFAVSAALMTRFAAMAAPYFDTAEIIELHHDAKVDAPSGTAIATAEAMQPPEGGWAEDLTRLDTLENSRGGLGPNGVRIHSVRMRGMVAHQEVVLGAAGQTLTIRQDSYDRQSFMPGVVLACRRVPSTPGLTVGLDPLL